MHIILHALSLLVVVKCITVMHLRYQRSQARRPEQNTALNSNIEQFITAKISGKGLKQWSRKCYVSTVHNSKNIRLRIKTVEQNILIVTTGHFTTAKTWCCAKGSSNAWSRESICGWNGEHPGLTVWNLLNHTRIENAHKVRKKTFVFYVAVIRTTTGGQTGTPEQRKGRGDSKRVDTQWKLMKNKTNRYLLCLFLFINNVDLKIIKEIIEKYIPNFLGARIAAINLFQFDLDKPWNYCYTVMTTRPYSRSPASLGTERACVSRYDQSASTAKARNDAHIASTGVQ